MKKIMILAVVVVSASVMYAGGQQCAKKCGTSSSCNKSATQTTTVTDPATGQEIVCNHVAGEDCAAGSCPRATAMAKTVVPSQENIASADMASHDHKKSWWKIWKKNDADCCATEKP
ncbi:MAG: hypothetical protein HN729_02375 [Candidatus Marinimicrobia bacterium]|jgi:hypothetical protein|nr:hypothetical protein [Candidatus Neomarinimicrobiota bacterium]MBT3632829.1 hypothetical protein [Candidatus Neomarinimicrobiota bacterium]MBT3681939.1 hypothetical protein [Candidatus Neomarinimicrobiota bacterium]MBT3759032.1 hypothetical protein [Candidatus Neomarinimicrobiota bacterium]MBT3895069.1 hypothetical protein [Candidatus Neomarinimicrobiota bacterium]